VFVSGVFESLCVVCVCMCEQFVCDCISCVCVASISLFVDFFLCSVCVYCLC